MYANKHNSVDRSLAFAVAALVTFMIANAFPFLTISVSGNTHSISVISAVSALYVEGMWVLAMLCLAFILLIPLFRMCGLLYILTPLRFGLYWPGIEWAFRMIVSMSPWSMMEIYFLGAIVALVKLATMASIELGVSFWAFAILNLLALGATQLIDRYTLWAHIVQVRATRS